MKKKVIRAIISVTNKEGIVPFAKGLQKQGIEILSTGGTAKLLQKNKVKVTSIDDFTGFPEMMDGRVKTLNPKIHGGILNIRDNKEHQKAMKEHNIEHIDMVVVNLYRFDETVATDPSLATAIENIDIGGPTMIRASAKNHRFVAVVTDPEDYKGILEELKTEKSKLSGATRLRLATKAFQLTARYDGSISNYLGSLSDDYKQAKKGVRTKDFPETYTAQYKKVQDLRYGENPHQKSAFYEKYQAQASALSKAKQLQGKELSFNNILDLEASMRLNREFHEPCCVIIKHNNPCGTAESKKGLVDAFEKALKCDPVSAFGGIVSLNKKVTKELALKMSELFLEAVIAPGYDKAALQIFSKKKNLRLMELPLPKKGEVENNPFDIKVVTGGALIQDLDQGCATDLKIITKRKPTEDELSDLIFAWNVAKHVKSNAIVYAKDRCTIGIGAGQMSRIDSTVIAALKAEKAGLIIPGCVMASDAFFPFRDNIDMAAMRGVRAIIQPAGSIRDKEVIDACNERGIAMVATGMRHFRH